MSICCCISDEPLSDPRGRIKSVQTDYKFQVLMMESPCANLPSFFWFCGQCLPFTCCITQVLLRRKVLNGDMSKYVCCQGYFNVCCIKAGTMGEEACPDVCLCVEATLCNSCAVSASRMYIMDKYALSSDPCDYRLIRLSNILQLLACICDIAACITERNEIRELARLIDRIADIVFHIVSGCMTAQAAYEVDYQANRAKLHHSIDMSSNDVDPYHTPFLSQAHAVYVAPSAPVYNPVVFQSSDYNGGGKDYQQQQQQQKEFDSFQYSKNNK